MTGNDEDLPVLLVDGSRFSDFAGFVREFSRLLDGYRWRGSLDAFNDVLRGGFGTPDGAWVLRWLDSDVSRRALGHEATVHWLEENLLVCHPGNRSAVAARIAAAQRGEGPTLFDAIVDIIRIHGPGGRESDDGILLELA